MHDIELVRWTISLIMPALTGLLGVAVGYWLTKKRETSQRRYSFLERQLKEFYSPLLGLRAEIRMRGELRTRIHSAADVEWRKLCADARETSDPVGSLQKLQDIRSNEFDRIFEYDDRQLTEELMPAYRRMLAIFRDNLWLAEVESRQYYSNLLEFVEIWERWLARAIPHEVVENLEHSEAALEPLYKHLEERHAALRTRLSKGEP